MNREIKFRGRVEEYLHFGDLTHVLHRQKQMICVDQTLVEQDTIGQFTGLYDTNGKEIYEGDILECGKWVGLVLWNEKYATFVVQFDFERKINPVPLGAWHTITIVGNIHDNPELFKINTERNNQSS